jgi:DNA-directed RNA polymerase specialized sigma24 family protein
MTRAEVTKKAWVTRRANEERSADSPPDTERTASVNHKYPSNSRIDEAITKAYNQYREFGNRKAIRNLAERIAWPRWAVNRRAREIGIAQTKESAWSEAEESILHRWGHLVDQGIQTKLAKAGFQRSLTAVHLKVTRLRIKKNLDGYSATSLSKAFGVDGHVVTKWIQRGLLKAERRGTARIDQQNGDTYWITNAAVKQFIVAYPNEISLAKVEKFWFLDLVTDGGISDKTVELGQLRSQVNVLLAAAQRTAKIEAEKRKVTQKAHDAELARYQPKRRAIQREVAAINKAIGQLQGRRVTREDARELHAMVDRLSQVFDLPPESAVAAESVDSFISTLIGKSLPAPASAAPGGDGLAGAVYPRREVVEDGENASGLQGVGLGGSSC